MRYPTLTLKDTTFTWGAQTYLMCILNATLDSFSDDGLLREEGDWIELAVRLAESLITAGAHLLDIGGESTRPGSQPTPLEEELRRVIPLIRVLANRIKVPISVDTYKAEVARQAVEAG